MAGAPESQAFIELWGDNEIIGTFPGAIIEDSPAFYRLTITSAMLDKYIPSKEGSIFQGWEVNAPTSSNYTNPTGLLKAGDEIYSTTSMMYLTSKWNTPSYKTRVLFKTDTTENWDSVENSFQSMKGELYFYKDAGETKKTNHAGNKIYRQQLRIGDGTNKINKLAFWRNPYISRSEIDALFGTSSTTNLLDTATLDSLVLG